MQAQEILFGIAYNDRRGEEKWVSNTQTWCKCVEPSHNRSS
jgi:hypothetical protein